MFANSLITSTPTLSDISELKHKLSAMIKTLLNRPQAYAGGIQQVVEVRVEDGIKITGTASTSDRRLVSFEIDTSRNRIGYGFSPRQDSYTEGRLEVLGVKNDAMRKKSVCGKGLPCSRACIDPKKTCRLPSSAIASRSEMQQIRSVGLSLRSAITSLPQKEESPDLEAKTIRELQTIASQQGIYRANHQTKEQLVNTLRVLEQDPDSQERLKKTLEKRRTVKQLAKKNLPKDVTAAWKAIEQISNINSRRPNTAAVLTAAFLMGVAKSQMDRMRDRYKDGLNDSALMAMERSQKLPIEETSKPNITFAVGGFSGIGSNGQRIKDVLEAPLDNTKGENWFKKDNHIIPFNHKEFDISTPPVSKRDENGKYNPTYLGTVATGGFGKFLNNLKRGRNDASVDLASEIYAYANRYPKKQINLLGHGAGGNIVNESVEILSRMKPDKIGKGMPGKEILNRLNVVNLGTPHFGFANDRGWKTGEIKHRTITSSGDPFSVLPKRAAQWISSVRGHEPDDYLKNSDVRERIRESFGYYSSSLLGRREADKRRKENREAIGEALSVVSPSAGKLWNQLGKIQDKAKDNPAAAAILTGAVLTGTGVATYATLQRRYTEGLPTSAVQAQEQVVKKETGSGPNRKVYYEVNGKRIENIPNNNITFVVGGVGSNAQDIIEAFPDDIKGTPNKRGKLTGGQTYFVPFDDALTNSVEVSGDLSSFNRDMDILRKGYGGILGRTLKGTVGKSGVRNPDAIALAAQLYGHAQTQSIKPGKNYAINIVGAGTGGLTAREALEILSRMSPDGARVAKRIKLATLGTPSFGLVNNKPGSDDRNKKFVVQETNFMGDKDPIASRLSARENGMTVRVAGVNGHNAKSYLQNESVRKEISDRFRYIKRSEPTKASPTKPKLLQLPLSSVIVTPPPKTEETPKKTTTKRKRTTTKATTKPKKTRNGTVKKTSSEN